MNYESAETLAETEQGREYGYFLKNVESPKISGDPADQWPWNLFSTKGWISSEQKQTSLCSQKSGELFLQLHGISVELNDQKIRAGFGCSRIHSRSAVSPCCAVGW
jgi:hypothetical protein